MFTASVENSEGESLNLTQSEPNWQIVSITGLNPPNAQINLTDIAGLDGAKFNSSKLNTRNLVITLKLNGDVEINRQNLYRYFRTKDTCTFYFQNQNRDVSIQGYVETVECNLFSSGEIMQISIICPFPYFASIAEVIADISNWVSAFVFPFSINYGDPIPFSMYVANRVTDVYNNSESATGVVIFVDVTDSISKIEIKCTDTGGSMTLNYNFVEGDRVIINTNKGQKSIYLLRDGALTNIFSSMVKGSEFFQLGVGSNYFGYLIDNGANDDKVFITFHYSNLYRGV